MARKNVLSERHLTTLLHLLRRHADAERMHHGAMVERLGGLELTPSECEAWADELERQALPVDSTEDWLA